MRFNILLSGILISFFVCSCQELVARRPKKHTTTNFYKEVIEQKKRLVKLENRIIKKEIEKDTLENYQKSASGFWYTYNVKKIEEAPKPKPEDVVIIRYNIKGLDNEVIYSEEELGEKEYKIDKEDFIPALQDGIKLMKKGETITFVIPSYRAFGVVGDENRIGMNKTIKSTVTLIDIKSNIKK
ncbi:gliding motility-associated peptidyl-prolyl isomerase GldI [Tenacibaculum maritimum]|uniref:gliding motility-associated peptidyl-prolyl isomerase GldI n=1 Tax=Tenacibaculum maritimum TaxID=107401 RepID=UPI0012E62B08|nr:gliding motility-associated peptidyl-prolyl isomerase GldI [Tenacibaculum maritimum]CAA0244073.1 Gliding motility lipoprotein precursor GldI [Tenacibaculum maritimum]